MKKNKKNLIVVLIALITIGITIAFFANNNNLLNSFHSAPFGTVVTQTLDVSSDWAPGSTVPTNFSIKNSEDGEVAIRVSYTENWSSYENDNIPNVQDGVSATILNFSNQSDWIKEGNYYYYKYKLGKNEVANNFIESVTFNSEINAIYICENQELSNDVCTSNAGIYSEASYQLSIKIETAQYSKYKTIWNTLVEIG